MTLRADFRVEFKGETIPLNAKTVRTVFKKIVMDEAKEIQGLYKHVQSHFSSKNRVKIRRSIGTESGNIYSAVGTDQERGSVLIWLEDGTDIRYRNMSFNWISKTRGGLSFGAGRGSVAGFGINPGIKPRYFRDAIVEKRLPVFHAKADREFSTMVKKAGWL